jgi:hypothetical protein
MEIHSIYEDGDYRKMSFSELVHVTVSISGYWYVPDASMFNSVARDMR